MTTANPIPFSERIKFYAFAIARLPSLAWWGVRPVVVNDMQCDVSVSYGWRTQNPFKSIYFSALLGTAELSTGMLVMRHVSKHGNYSMLVTDVQASFTKKATGKIIFSCKQGDIIEKAIETSKINGSEVFVLRSTGINAEGNQICSVDITWSIRERKNR